MPREKCGCYYESDTGCWILCTRHIPLVCVKCGTIQEEPITNEDGECEDCADPKVACDYCHRSVPKRLTDNGAVCFDCLAANWNEAEAS